MEVVVPRLFASTKIALLTLCLVMPSTDSFGQSDLSDEELTLLKVVSGIHATFQQYASDIWPGYDLSTTPYVVYLPDQWALYLNAKEVPEGFETYPTDWPDIGPSACMHPGRYKDLVGQFAFHFQIDSVMTFAMGMPSELLFSFSNPSYTLFSNTIHEGFHQYQFDHFGDIPWAREETYPILNVENTALASLEMHILKDALVALYDGHRGKTEEVLKEFAAVRRHRWMRSGDFIRRYEQGQDINEGTARYVEMRATDCFSRLNVEEKNIPLLSALAEDMADIHMPDLLIEDIDSRLTGVSVAPDDMLRNRIYPVGATLGFLLDSLHIDWKTKFQGGGSEISFSQLILQHFNLDTDYLEEYVDKARTGYGYEDILAGADHLIGEYVSSYEEAREEFDNERGIKVQIQLPSSGVRRFRSTKEQKWVTEEGEVILYLHYNLYSLKSDNVVLEIHNKALLDESDWEQGTRTVTFFSQNISSVIADASVYSLSEDFEHSFDKIEVAGDDFTLQAEVEGNVSFAHNRMKITLE